MPDAIKAIFGKRLEMAMREASLDLCALSGMLGIHPGLVSDLLQGRGPPDFDLLAKISRILDRPVYWFFRPLDDEIREIMKMSDVVKLASEAITELQSLKKELMN